MRARMMVENPDDIEMTLKVTMTIREWTKLRDQLESSWPSSRLGSAINAMLTEARRVYHAPETDPFGSKASDCTEADKTA